MGCTASNTVSDAAPPTSQPTHSSQQHSQQRSSAPNRSVPEIPLREDVFSSKAELDSQRAEFWGTRIQGNAMVWTTLRSAAEAALDDDVALMHAILAASGINCPNGTLELCYDDRGFEYKVPSFCYQVQTFSAEPISLDACVKAIPVISQDYEPDTTLKIRINPGDFNLSIAVNTRNNIGFLKQKILEKSMEISEKENPKVFPVCEPGRQRIIFMGKELKNDGQLIVEAKLDDSKVVQVFLRAAPA